MLRWYRRSSRSPVAGDDVEETKERNTMSAAGRADHCARSRRFQQRRLSCRFRAILVVRRAVRVVASLAVGPNRLEASDRLEEHTV